MRLVGVGARGLAATARDDAAPPHHALATLSEDHWVHVPIRVRGRRRRRRARGLRIALYCTDCWYQARAAAPHPCPFARRSGWTSGGLRTRENISCTSNFALRSVHTPKKWASTLFTVAVTSHCVYAQLIPVLCFYIAMIVCLNSLRTQILVGQPGDIHTAMIPKPAPAGRQLPQRGTFVRWW